MGSNTFSHRLFFLQETFMRLSYSLGGSHGFWQLRRQLLGTFPVLPRHAFITRLGEDSSRPWRDA